MKWSPEVLDDMYLDAIDHHGLEYWYDVIEKVSKKIKSENG